MDKNKKVYISIPITGRSLEIVAKEIESTRAALLWAGYNSVSPFDICPEQGKPYSYYMGRDIEVLLECDAIYMCPGWRESKGCRAEAAIAEIYGIPRVNAESEASPWLSCLSLLLWIFAITLVVIMIAMIWTA